MEIAEKRKRNGLSILLIMCLLLLIPAGAFGASFDETIEVTVDGTRLDAYSDQVLDEVNRLRGEQGLQPLTKDSDLQEAALQRAAEIAVYFSHTRPNGKSCFSLTEKMAGENIAIGYPNPEMVVKGWMDSKGHREAILSTEYNSVGIGCVVYDGICHWVQTFGRIEGNGKNAPGNKDVKYSVETLAALINLQYSGKEMINLNSSPKSEELQVKCRSMNVGWPDYGWFTLDPQLLTYQSSDPEILSVDEAGNMTPKKTGDVILTMSLKANPDCSLSKEIQVQSVLTEDMVQLSQTSYVYNGKNRMPKVSVKGLSEGDYIVTYKNNKKVGTAAVIVEGIGHVTGTVEKNFKINYNRPAKVSILTPAASGKKVVKARWKKTKCAGYQIQYSDSKNFKNYKTIYVKNGDATTAAISGLKKGKRCYVKVRAYNLYEGKRVYGQLSGYRSVVCK